jgi:hypothetical protein
VQAGEDDLTQQIVAADEIVVEDSQTNSVLLGGRDGHNELLVPDGVQGLLELRGLPYLGVPSIFIQGKEGRKGD